jgi:molecular chaperone HscA
VLKLGDLTPTQIQKIKQFARTAKETLTDNEFAEFNKTNWVKQTLKI